MVIRHTPLLATLLLLGCPPPRPPMVPSEAARIQRVEDGLLPPVVVRGSAVTGRPIDDRMERYGVPAVGVAVIDAGRLVWARGYGTATAPGTRFPLDAPLSGELGPEATPESVARHLLARGEPVRLEGRTGVVYDPTNGQGAVVMTGSLAGAPLVEEVLRSIAVEYGWQGFPGPVEKAVAAVDPAALASYEGRYTVGASTLVVARDRARLTITTPAGETADLYPESPDRFFLLENDTTITFERNAEGEVVALRASIGGREITAPREL